MIVKNGEKNIARCLESVNGLVDEMIVVDTGSSDRTKEIALNLGAKVFDFEWNDNYSDARNFSLDLAKGDWILVLDDDESISRSDFDKIRELIHGENVGYHLVQRSYTGETGIMGWESCKDDLYEEGRKYSGFFPAKMIRLFKNDKRIRFEGAVHETVVFSLEKIGKISDSNIPIHHYGFTRFNKEKIRKYVEIMEKEAQNNYYSEYQIGSQLREIGDFKNSMTHLLKSIQLNPLFHWSMIEIGILLVQNNMIQESERLFEESIKIKPEGIAWNHLGIVKIHAGKYSEGINCFEKAVELNPKNADFYFNLAQALKEVGRLDESRIVFQKAVELNPYYDKKL